MLSLKRHKVAASVLVVLLLVSLLGSFYPSKVEAAITVDSQAQSGLQTSSSFSYTDTVSSFSNTEIVITMDGIGNHAKVSSVTVNGQNATLEASTTMVRTGTTAQISNIWDFAATTAGQQVVTVNTTGTGFVDGLLSTTTALNGVNQATPLDGTGCSVGKKVQEGIATTSTTVSGDYFVDSFHVDSSGVTPSPGAQQTGSFDISNLGIGGASYKAATTTGLQSMYWTWTALNASSTDCLVAYQPAAGGGGGGGGSSSPVQVPQLPQLWILSERVTLKHVG